MSAFDEQRREGDVIYLVFYIPPQPELPCGTIHIFQREDLHNNVFLILGILLREFKHSIFRRTIPLHKSVSIPAWQVQVEVKGVAL